MDEPDQGTPVVRLFGSNDFFRLWLAQVVSALGDWIGFFAIVAIAARIGGSSSGAAIGVVMTARILPGLFLAPAAGVLLDRWDRKRVMVSCDVGRGLVLLSLPFVTNIPQLVVASLLLEILTVLWSPAKEAEVPNLVPATHLATANSLSLVAAYGTIPVAAAIFAGLAKLAGVLQHNESLGFLRLNDASLAVYFDVLTFFLSAVLISSLGLGGRAREDGAAEGPRRIDFSATFDEFKEGWRFIAVNRRVSAVMVGLGAGLIGGGMLVPLGPLFTEQVLGGGTAGFGLVVFALGTGAAVGVSAVSVVQTRLHKPRAFSLSVLVAGASLLLGASMSTLIPALVLVACLGAAAGVAYVLGFTVLQESVSDDIRGRTFTALYTLVRLCLLISFAVGPFLSSALGGVASRLLGDDVSLWRFTISVPGVRLTLWLAAIIIVAAGVLAGRVLRAPADDGER
ncbi:MAG: MFS transporter [Actinobacteria bacterium]|nr:MFS transporter [Actinomycetota bacterium]MBW3643738.1 MFS transporter [Actinomycetota bacterium]